MKKDILDIIKMIEEMALEFLFLKEIIIKFLNQLMKKIIIAKWIIFLHI